ncbi:MAG: hypothetical protein HOU81_23320, partial [Hamadaea sp.]|nr:hypothetical protein [Hamadaea sp.]
MLSEVCRLIAPARLATYSNATDGDVVKALSLYRWNQDIAGGFLRPLCNLEVALRNSLVDQIEELTAPLPWWEHSALRNEPKFDRRIRDAVSQLRFLRRSLTRDNLVPELSFGFWVGLLSSNFDRTLWRAGLHLAFPHFPGPRRELRATFQIVLNLRNRIGHHEPIYHRHLAADHVTIHKLLGYLSP